MHRKAYHKKKTHSLHFKLLLYIFVGVIVVWFVNIMLFSPGGGGRGGGDSRVGGLLASKQLFKQPIAIGIISSLTTEGISRRLSMRDTCLRFADNRKGKGVFVVGQPECILKNEKCDESTDELLRKLKIEISDYNDILFVTSSDENLSQKTITFHCWTADHFPTLEYSLKTNDDTFIRLDTIVHLLKSMPKNLFYWGFTMRKVKRIHVEGETDFETSEYFYPPYNLGVANALSADLVHYINNNKNILRPLTSEDVMIGVWISHLLVHPYHDDRFQAQHGICFKEMITKSPVTPKEMSTLFERVSARIDLCDGIDASVCPIGRECLPSQVPWADQYSCDTRGCEDISVGGRGSKIEEDAYALLASASSLCPLPTTPTPTFSTSTSADRGASSPANLVANPSFDGEVNWFPYGSGYEIDNSPNAARTAFANSNNYEAPSAILLYSLNTGDTYGASQVITVNQKMSGIPIMLLGWARTSTTTRKDSTPNGGSTEQHCSINMDITFDGGSRALGVAINIEESKSYRLYTKVYNPPKPIKEILLLLSLKNRLGKVWFDDLQVLSLDNPIATCTASYVARNVPLLTLPANTNTNTNTKSNSNSNSIIHSNPLSCYTSSSPRFILIWTTTSNTFTLRHLRVAESILYHTPTACVRIFTNTLPPLYFSDLAFRGYDIRTVQYELHEIAENMPGQGWLDNIAKWKASPHFYAHSSDYLRFLLLYKYGGIYSDFDSILLQPLPIPILTTDFIGVEWCEEEGLEWCVTIEDSAFTGEYQASLLPKPPTTSTQFSFSIGLMSFSPQNPFVAEILQRFATDYKPERWGCGTVMASMVYKQAQINNNNNNDNNNEKILQVKVVPPQAFYPIGYQDIPTYFTKEDTTLWNAIVQSSYAFHLFGKVSGKEVVHRGSMVHRALSDFALSIHDFPP